MTIRRRIGPAALVAAGAIGLYAFSTTPAYAHDDSIVIVGAFNTVLGSANTTEYHRRLKVCDDKADGQGVYADYKTSAGDQYSLSDSNGAASPCASTYPPEGAYVTSYRVCVRNYKCTSWTAP